MISAIYVNPITSYYWSLERQSVTLVCIRRTWCEN